MRCSAPPPAPRAADHFLPPPCRLRVAEHVGRKAGAVDKPGTQERPHDGHAGIHAGCAPPAARRPPPAVLLECRQPVGLTPLVPRAPVPAVGEYLDETGEVVTSAEC